MEKNLKLRIKEEYVSVIAIAAILFTNLVIESSEYISYVYIILGITLIYALFLILKKPENLKNIFYSYSFLWIVMFSVIMFIYGYFGENESAYSLKFHFLNLIWIMILLIILQNNSDKTIDIMAKASSIVIIMMSIYIITTGSFSLIEVFTKTDISRIGTTAVGNENTTAISYIFLIIPIIYKITVDKTKKYIPTALIGILFMFLTGSKKGIISLVLTIAIIGIGKSTNKNKLLKNIIKTSFIIAIIIALCYYIPVLHTLVWDRLESMMMSLNDFNTTDESSTGIRMNFIKTAFTKAWNKPILGHGWASFADMYGYSSLYKTNLYTHNNYAEILFSFGLTGLFLYYWFPIRTIRKNIKNKNNNSKIFCWLYIAILLFIDFGTVSCYSSILGFLGFSIINLVLKIQTNRNKCEGIGCIQEENRLIGGNYINDTKEVYNNFKIH